MLRTLSRAALIMNSKVPAETRQFYRNLGWSWKNREINRSTFSLARTRDLWLVLPMTPSEETDFKLLFLDGNNQLMICFPRAEETIEATSCKPQDTKVDAICSAIASEDLDDSPAKMIPIMRVIDIHETKQHMSQLGRWIEEKHGMGPIHYCLDKDELTMEIYPQSKHRKTPIDLFVECESLEPIKDYIGSKSNDMSFCVDPNGIRVSIQLKNDQGLDKSDVITPPPRP